MYFYDALSIGEGFCHHPVRSIIDGGERYAPAIVDRLVPARVLKHRELDHAVFDLAPRESRTRHLLELGTTFVEIAEGLILRPKRRLETAYLPNRANRQHESNRLFLAQPCLRYDPDTLGHKGPPSR